MPPERPAPGTPAAWLRYARSDLALGRVPISGEILLEALCYHIQQAAEKSIKAVLTHLAIPFPRTHNLKVLLELLPPTLVPPDLVAQAAALTDYAVVSRYPGAYEAVTEDEYQEALRLGEAVVLWAEGAIHPNS